MPLLSSSQSPMSENIVLRSLQTSQSMELCLPIKRNKGRQRIEMKKIEKKSNLMVTFSKRKQGFFRKASELSILCGSEISVIVKSPGGKFYSFGTPSVESVLHRLYGLTPTDEDYEIRKTISRSRIEYSDAERRLAKEKETEINYNNEFWWNWDVESMNNVQDLEEYMGKLEGFRGCFMQKAFDFQLQSSSGFLPDLKSLEDGNGCNKCDDLGHNARTCGDVLKDRVAELRHDTNGYDDIVDFEKLFECDFDELFEGLEEKNFSDASSSLSSSTAHNADSFGLVLLENSDNCDMDAIFECLEDEKISDTSAPRSCFSADPNFGLTDEDSSYLDDFLENLL